MGFKSALSKVKSLPGGIVRAPGKIIAGRKDINLGHSSHGGAGLGRVMGHGLLSEAFHSGLGIAASGGLGYLHGKYREKASVKLPVANIEVPANLAVGVVGKLVAVGMSAHSRGRSKAAVILNTVANAGLYSHFYSLGVAKGTKDSGRKVYILESSGKAPASLGDLRQTEVVGDIPPAVGGRILSDEELAEMARSR